MKISNLSLPLLENNIDEIININRIDVDTRMHWTVHNFLKPTDSKWKFSIFAQEQDEILGYVIASKKDELTIHIHLIMISSIHRNKKLGILLINEIESIGKSNGLSRLTLWIYDDLVNVGKFYTRLGFKKKESRINESSQKLSLLEKNLN